MQERHKNKDQYFREQIETTEKYVIPYITQSKPFTKEAEILEIGCGEGGNLVPFIKMGCKCRGIDINENKVNIGNKKINELFPEADASLIFESIYEVDGDKIGRYDIIMLRDVIEHLPGQNDFMKHLHTFLKPEGVVFFGFPPWYMPFGGHQQVLKSKVLSKLPYYHILPKFIYKSVLRLANENESVVEELMEIKETGITIETFVDIVESNNFKFLEKTLWLINPNYKVKFGLTPRKQLPIFRNIPFLRNFVTTCCYALITKDN